MPVKISLNLALTAVIVSLYFVWLAMFLNSYLRRQDTVTLIAMMFLVAVLLSELWSFTTQLSIIFTPGGVMDTALMFRVLERLFHVGLLSAIYNQAKKL